MKTSLQWRRLAALALAMGLAATVSAPAESRPRRGTDLERMIAELERVLGPEAVEMRHGVGSAERASTRHGSRHLPSAATTRPEAPVPAGATEAAIVAEINAQRAAYGLAPLAREERLSAAACERADDMFARGYFAHVGPDGRSPFVTVRENGYRYRTVGENLAVGYRSARAVVDGWMRSPGHRANILARDYGDVGIAIHDGSPVRGYGGPTVVALYASER